MQRLEIKSTITRVTMALLMMLLTTMTAWAQFSGGNGSEGNPYEITSYNDLLTLRNNVNNGGTIPAGYLLNGYTSTDNNDKREIIA